MRGGWDLDGKYYPPSEALEWKAEQVVKAHPEFAISHEDTRPYSEIVKHLGLIAELGE